MVIQFFCSCGHLSFKNVPSWEECLASKPKSSNSVGIIIVFNCKINSKLQLDIQKGKIIILLF
jgi:hypothetical protein